LEGLYLLAVKPTQGIPNYKGSSKLKGRMGEKKAEQ